MQIRISNFDVLDDPDNHIFEVVGEDALSSGDGFIGDYIIAETRVQSIDVEDVLASLEWEPIMSNHGHLDDFLLFDLKTLTLLVEYSYILQMMRQFNSNQS